MNSNKKYFVKSLKINGRTMTVILLGAFIIYYLFLTLQTVSSGSKLALLEKQEEELTKKNKDLTLQLVEASSLTKLSQRAQDLGFARPLSTLYLTREDTVAKLP